VDYSTDTMPSSYGGTDQAYPPIDRSGQPDAAPFSSHSFSAENASHPKKSLSSMEAGRGAGGGAELSERERNLLEREAELRRREQKLGIVEKNIKALTPNWPFPWYAIEYHDIDAEIPAAKVGMMKRLYVNFLLTAAALTTNWIAMLGIWFSGDASGPSYTLWSTLYLVGIPGAWKLWYRPIYFAYRDKTTLRYFCFLLSFAAHCFFVVIMALGLPNMAAGGLMTMIQQFAVGHPIAALFTFLAMLVWACTAVLSILNFKKVQNEWGKEGVDMTSITEQLKNEVRESLVPVAAEVVRGAA